MQQSPGLNIYLYLTITIGRGGIRSYTPVKSGFAAGNPLYIGDDGKIINTCGTASHPWYGDENGAKEPVIIVQNIGETQRLPGAILMIMVSS